MLRQHAGIYHREHTLSSEVYPKIVKRCPVALLPIFIVLMLTLYSSDCGYVSKISTNRRISPMFR